MTDETKEILVVAEYDHPKIKPVTLEIIACARKLRHLTRGRIKVALIGESVSAQAEPLASVGEEVILIETPEGGQSRSSFLKGELSEYIREFQPHFLIAAHNSAAVNYLPELAVDKDAACITGVKDVSEDQNGLLFHRPVWNGKFDAAMRSEKTLTLLTVQPGAFPPVPEVGEQPGNISGWVSLEAPVRDRRIRYYGDQTPPPSDFSFEDARVIVAAGRGIGEKEALEKMEAFTALFQRSATAGSRPLIDAGWMPYRHQVGITGKSVAPPVYIACGISGSSQHMAGMAGSEFIISVNTDPEAAIFNFSDICIVADLHAFIDAFMQLARERRESGS